MCQNMLIKIISVIFINYLYISTSWALITCYSCEFCAELDIFVDKCRTDEDCFALFIVEHNQVKRGCNSRTANMNALYGRVTKYNCSQSLCNDWEIVELENFAVRSNMSLTMTIIGYIYIVNLVIVIRNIQYLYFLLFLFISCEFDCM